MGCSWCMFQEGLLMHYAGQSCRRAVQTSCWIRVSCADHVAHRLKLNLAIEIPPQKHALICCVSVSACVLWELPAVARVSPMGRVLEGASSRRYGRSYGVCLDKHGQHLVLCGQPERK